MPCSNASCGLDITSGGTRVAQAQVRQKAKEEDERQPCSHLPFLPFAFLLLPFVLAGRREAERQTPALADYSERDRRPPVAVDESPEVGAREGRAVDGFDHVAGAQSARGARAVGSDGDDEQAAARPEARSPAR